MMRYGIYVILLVALSCGCYSQIYSQDNTKFVYKNNTKYEISVEEPSDGGFKSKTSLIIYEENSGKQIIREVIEINNGVPFAEESYFGQHSSDKEYVLIIARYHFFIFDLKKTKLAGPYEPKSWGLLQDAQSGMLADLKIILEGKYVAGYSVDIGTFLYEITELNEALEVAPANIPFCNQNHIYILPHANNKTKFFGLFVSTENWTTKSKVIFKNRKVAFDDNSHFYQIPEKEIDEVITKYPFMYNKFTFFKECLSDNSCQYLVVNNFKGEFVDIPKELKHSDESELKHSDESELKKYLENLK